MYILRFCQKNTIKRQQQRTIRKSWHYSSEQLIIISCCANLRSSYTGLANIKTKYVGKATIKQPKKHKHTFGQQKTTINKQNNSCRIRTNKDLPKKWWFLEVLFPYAAVFLKCCLCWHFDQMCCFLEYVAFLRGTPEKWWCLQVLCMYVCVLLPRLHHCLPFHFSEAQWYGAVCTCTTRPRDS